MPGVDYRALLDIGERIEQFRSKPWRDRFATARRIAAAVVGDAVEQLTKTLLCTLYAPAAIALRLLGIRFLTSPAMTTHFGHVAVDPALYVKAKALGMFPEHRSILVVSRRKVPNRFLLSLWESRLRVVSHPVTSMILTPFKWSRWTRLPIYMPEYRIETETGEILTHGPAVDEIERRYELIKPDTPLFTISDELSARGRAALGRLGVPEGAWVVAMHIRESGYHHTLLNPIHDSDPRSYLKAAEAIIGRGGWVIRIGDPSMTPLPEMEGLIDYAHSPERADWLDVFIMGSSRFLLGCSSGPHAVPALFGGPVAAANWVPMCQGPWGPRDLRIPKLHLAGTPPWPVTFERVLLSEMRDWSSHLSFRRAGVTWRDSTPEEVRDLAVEMMDRLDGVAEYDQRDHELQRRFSELVQRRISPSTFGTLSRVGRDFLRQHADLLLPETGTLFDEIPIVDSVGVGG